MKRIQADQKAPNVGNRLFRDNQALRSFLCPFADILRKKTYERYLRSPDSWYLKSLKGIYAGKRCFIIGNGPSLCTADLELLKEEYTFAVNRIYDIFDQTDWRPAFYVAVDQVFLKNNYQKLAEYDLGHMFLNVPEKARLDYPIQKMTRIISANECYFDAFHRPYNMWSDCVSSDVSHYLYVGGTVVFAAIQLALYMGFSEIYLLGVDFSYRITRDAEGNVYEDESVKDHFSDSKSYCELNYETVLHVFKRSKEYCDTHGVVIKNATRGGKLEVFERTSLENIVGGGPK